MKDLLITQHDKTQLTLLSGHMYRLKYSLVMTYLKLEKPMIVTLDPLFTRFTDPVTGSSTSEKNHMLAHMVFEKVA